MANMLAMLRRVDVYRRVPKDFTQTTLSGGIVSVVTILTMVALFLIELNSYLTVEIVNEMFVDSTMGDDHVFDVLFSVTAHDIPCAILSVDVQDNMGRHDVGVEKLLRKRRYSADGAQLDMHEEVDPGSATAQQQVAADYAAQRGEHCNVHGHLRLNKVPGNFHISTHFAQRFVKLTGDDINFAHTIEHLNFGANLNDDFDIPGAFTPLNNFDVLSDVGTDHEYHFQIVPTVYDRLDGSSTSSYQFTYAYKAHPVNKHHVHGSHPPAVWFRYELSPITIRYREQSKSFGSFLVGVSAIIGGVFTVSTLVTAAFHSAHELVRKSEMGKLS